MEQAGSADGRAAVGDLIDQYQVVRHADIAVSGAAVGDTIHLISELIDNATAFSPPHTQVHVDATEVARGVAIDIADQGLGMSEEDRARANRMMSDPPEFDRLVLENNKAEQLGLFTAARLAERRDVHVEFGVSAYGGTRATVLLPDRILENPEPEQDQPEPEPVPAMPRQREHGWSGQVLSVASVPKPSTDDTTATKARETVWPPAEPPVEPAASEPERPQPPQPEQRQEGPAVARTARRRPRNGHRCRSEFRKHTLRRDCAKNPIPRSSPSSRPRAGWRASGAPSRAVSRTVRRTAPENRREVRWA